MSGRRNPKRWLIKRLGETGPRTGYELATDSERPDRIVPALHELERSGHITQDPHDHHYTLTPKGNETLMRIRSKNRGSNKAEPIDLAAARDRLVREFWGESGPAEQAVQDDPVLSERLAIALHDGMPAPDLSEVPLHRRPQAVEDAVSAFKKAATGGPCHFCGTRTARRSPAPVSVMDPDVVPGFTTAHDRPCCAWCAHMLSSRTLDEFREQVGNAVAGTIGLTAWGNLRYDSSLVPWAGEVGYVGTPWGHLSDEKRVWAIRARAHQVVHKSRFVVRPEQARLVAIPGIETTIWPTEALPGKERKFFHPLADAVRAAEEEQALEARREHAEKGRANHMARLNQRVEENANLADQQQARLRDRAKKLGVL